MWKKLVYQQQRCHQQQQEPVYRVMIGRCRRHLSSGHAFLRIVIHMLTYLHIYHCVQHCTAGAVIARNILLLSTFSISNDIAIFYIETASFHHLMWRQKINLTEIIQLLHYYTRLTVWRPLFQDNLGKPVPESKLNQSVFKWGKRWWGLGWQWHQLDHMETICTSLQTDNHTNTLSLNIYIPDALPDAQPTVSKH